MRLNAVKILKISIINDSKKVILKEIQKYLFQNAKKSIKPLKIYTPNTEQLVFAAKNSYFRAILNRADLTIPDTIGVVWAGHILTKNGPPKAIPGVEFMEELIALASNRHVPVGLIGGLGNLAVETLDCLQKKYSALTGWAGDGPEITIQNSKLRIQNTDEKQFFANIAQRVVHENTGIIFVALGPPKQEWFIEKLSQELSAITQKPVVLMAVGGSFDILSGHLPRAPLALRQMGFEWLWRLFLEPQRFFRQLSLIEFVWLVLRQKIIEKS